MKAWTQLSQWRRVWVYGLVVFLGACASDKPKPTPLAEISPKVKIDVAWQGRSDAAQFPLFVAAKSGQFILAGSNGNVVAYQATSGQTLWSTNIGAAIQAGVGSDGRMAALITRDNDLVAVAPGRVIWRSKLPARGVTAPLVAGGRVFVMTVNRVVHAFDGETGQRLWTLDRPGDALTLAQAGVISAFENTLLVGQGPRLTAVDPDNGTVRWEAPIASPRGANEVERLADLIGPLSRSSDVVCARAFQSAVGCVNVRKGQLLWSRNSGGWQSVAVSERLLVGADASDRITAWKSSTGEALWTQEKLLYRSLSGTVIFGGLAVFGDAEGQVHFIDLNSGEISARMPTDGSAIVAPPVVLGGLLLVPTSNGGLFACRTR